MNYKLRCDIKRLIEIVRGACKSEASCFCGRHYRLTFGLEENVTQLLDLIEAQVDTTGDRFGLLEGD